jgi:hypothetical protein
MKQAATGGGAVIAEANVEQQTGYEVPRCAAMWCTHLTAPGKEYCSHHAAFEGRASWQQEELEIVASPGCR